MKRRCLRKGVAYLFFCTAMILGALLLFGCEGDTGPPGPAGPQGEPGTAAPGGGDLVATVETCSICHGQGKIADIAVAHPDDPAFLGEEIIISNITLTNSGGVPVVSFHLETRDGTPVSEIDGQPLNVDMFRFMMGDLVPAGTATQWGTWDSPYFERWVYEQAPSTRTGIVYPQGTLNVSDAANGNYTYTFATAFGSQTALDDAPDLDHTAGASHVQRLLLRFDGRDDPNITQRSVAFLDFNVPASGSQATALDPQRQFVTAEACEKCHSPNWDRAAHAGGYRDTRSCALCHSPLGFDTLGNEDRGQFMQDNDAYASVFFHKIHGAIDIPFWTEEGRIRGEGYEAVTFPQEIRDCVICHTDSGLDLGTQASMIDNWKTNPTIQICGSCHVDVDFATGANHPGGAQSDNTGCTFCHPQTGGGIGRSIDNAHDITPHVADPAIQGDKDYLTDNIREFDVTLEITPPLNGQFYAVGEFPQVTATLADHATGAPVASSIYTTPEDDTGAVGGGLSVAYIQISGPRARPFPVLATDSFTDPNWDGNLENIEDEHDMFVGGTDPQVLTDSSGFSYLMLPITDDLDPGTYLVRVVFADYGRVGSGNYRIDSTAWTTIQIGTADVEPKVAGNACVNCHGPGTAPFHDERHSVPFDTDQCLACHHDTAHAQGERLHGVPLANRVHAVHSANAKGDIYFFSDPGRDTLGTARDWTEVTYPREIMNCNTCHNFQYDEATNTFEGTYKSLPYMMPCAGCHVGEANDLQGDIPYVPGVVAHMRQNGGPWAVTNSPDN
jgi:hypothetical protein